MIEESIKHNIPHTSAFLEKMLYTLQRQTVDTADTLKGTWGGGGGAVGVGWGCSGGAGATPEK